MKRITNKIKNNKKRLLIISLILIILIIIILLYSLNVFKTTPKKQTKTTNSKYAYYIPDGSGGYTRTNTRPDRDLDYIKCNGEKLKKSKYTYNSTTGAFGISGITESTRCNLYFKPIFPQGSFANTLTINNSPTTYTTTPGQEISTTDEGLIEGPNDDYGAPTYYFRGTAPDNYVTFAGLTWRIVRINGDGSVRLVLNTTTGTDTVWNTNDTSTTWEEALSYATYRNSIIKGVVESWYNTNIGNNTNYSSKIVTSKFCNDRTYTTDTDYYYFGARNRLYPNGSIAGATPSYICPNSIHIYNLNVGLLTADEVAFAGGVYDTTNQSYYLYKSETQWWTLSPDSWLVSYGYVSAWRVYKDGFLYYRRLSNSHAVVPVISLSSDITVTTASSTNPGTTSNPYIVQ